MKPIHTDPRRPADGPVLTEPADHHAAANCGIARRTLVQGAAAIGALAATCLMPRDGLAAKGGGGGGGGVVTRYPLYTPPSVARPSAYTLAAALANVNFGPNRGNALAYNHAGGAAGFPGPTFVANRGDSVSINLANGLTQESTVHWHGMVVAPEQDGQPQDLVLPNGTRTYAFPIDQRACLNWYHPHAHMLTGEQVCLGLAGAFIVRDAEESALGLPGGAYELPLIVRDANFDSAGNLVYNPRASGFVGNTPLVNGTRNPTRDVGVALYRLRILNGANARLFRIALSNGAPLWLIGNDGGLLPTMASTGDIEFGPGERLDVLVDFRGMSAGARVMLRDLNAGWDLLEFAVTNTIPAVPSGVTLQSGYPLSTVAPLSDPGAPTRTFSFDGMSKINGMEFDMDRIDFQVPLAITERWRFTTNGNAPHPVHVHGASFQVVSRSGGRGRLFPWEGGWKDTVLLKDNETVDVLIRFDGFRGRYIMHCHKLEHEDMGMMSNFVVV